jgi:hypothetical protein
VLTCRCEKDIEEKKQRGKKMVEKNKIIERNIIEEKT